MANVSFALVLNLHQPTWNPRGSPPAPGVGSQGDSLGHQSDPPLAVEVWGRGSGPPVAVWHPCAGYL